MSTVCWEYALFLQVQGVLKSEGARAVPYTVDRADLTQLRDRHNSGGRLRALRTGTTRGGPPLGGLDH